jgi:quercetin dioxygenase-like cupin family protein
MEFRFRKGAAVPPHHHPHEQIGMVITGRCKFRIGSDLRTLGPGDGYSILPDVEHSVEFLEDSVLVDVFSPPREDYRS